MNVLIIFTTQLKSNGVSKGIKCESTVFVNKAMWMPKNAAWPYVFIVAKYRATFVLSWMIIKDFNF